MTKEEYNDENVNYCANCLSLKIVSLENSNHYYCGNCGDGTILENHIDKWKEEYYELYGKHYLERDIRMDPDGDIPVCPS